MKKILFLLPIFTSFALILFLPTAVSSQQTATTPAEAVREKVKDKIESVLKEPKAYIGIITDKTEGSLQIKNKDGQIQLVSVNSQEVSFAKVTKTTSVIKFGDIAIGDHVVAMGFAAANGAPGTKNGNGVLEAKRILVTDPIQDPKRQAILGKVTTIGKKDITIVDKSEKQWKVEFPKKWKGPDIDDLSKGENIIAMGEVNGSIVTVRTIQTVSNSSPAVSPSPTE